MMKNVWYILSFTSNASQQIVLRIDNCDERPIYKNSDISVTQGGKFIIFTSPQSPDLLLFNGVRQLSLCLK